MRTEIKKSSRKVGFGTRSDSGNAQTSTIEFEKHDADFINETTLTMGGQGA